MQIHHTAWRPHRSTSNTVNPWSIAAGRRQQWDAPVRGSDSSPNRTEGFQDLAPRAEIAIPTARRAGTTPRSLNNSAPSANGRGKDPRVARVSGLCGTQPGDSGGAGWIIRSSRLGLGSQSPHTSSLGVRDGRAFPCLAEDGVSLPTNGHSVGRDSIADSLCETLSISSQEKPILI